jgi:hypothetical protein
LSILRCLVPDGLLDLHKYHDYSALLSVRAQRQMSIGGRRVSMLAVASLAVAAAAWHQRGISGCSTINNQVKEWAVTAAETATMIATMMMIKMKATAAAAAAAWQWHGRQRGRIAAVGADLLQPAYSLAVAAAAWCQCGVSGSSTINNQQKASAATATEMATLIAITMTIKMKATAVAAEA